MHQLIKVLNLQFLDLSSLINLLVNFIHSSFLLNLLIYFSDHLIISLIIHQQITNPNYFSILHIVNLYTFKSSSIPRSFCYLSFSLYYLSNSFFNSSASFAFFLNFSNSFVYSLIFILLTNLLDSLQIAFIIFQDP